jgi:Uncharacterized protein conserved in bacteria
MPNAETLTLRTVGAIAELAPDAWNACALGRTADEARRPRNPFLSHAFLHALEASGSAVAERGWQPLHLTLEGAGDEAPRRRAGLHEIPLLE